MVRQPLAEMFTPAAIILRPVTVQDEGRVDAGNLLDGGHRAGECRRGASRLSHLMK